LTPVNDPPVAVSGTASTNEETPVTITVATDVDDPALTATCTSGGTYLDNGNGTVIYTPATNVTGSDTLTCSVTDGVNIPVSAVITVDITNVNDPPVADDDTAETNENVAVDIYVLNGDTDVDGDTLTVGSVDTTNTQGSVVNNGSYVTYTPATDFVGPDTFDYTASDDNGGTDTASVTVTVIDVICTDETVPFQSPSGIVNGSITKLGGDEVCKRFDLVATDPSGEDPATILFVPQGSEPATYRAALTLGDDAGANPLQGQLEYDPENDGTFKFVPWCDSATFVSGVVTDASVPTGDTWCIASELTVVISIADPSRTTTTWQVFGRDDPNFK